MLFLMMASVLSDTVQCDIFVSLLCAHARSTMHPCLTVNIITLYMCCSIPWLYIFVIV